MTKKRRRPIHLHVMVSEAEQAVVEADKTKLEMMLRKRIKTF